MTQPMEIPAFLLRTERNFYDPPRAGDTPVTPTPTAKPTRTKKTDAYVAVVKIKIPLDMANADSLAGAIKAVKAIEATLPAGSTCDVYGTLGKL